METDLKVLVFRDRDNKKNAEGKRSVLSRLVSRRKSIIIAAAAVLLVAAAACTALIGLNGHGAKAAEAQTTETAQAETTGITETVQAEAAQNEAEEAEKKQITVSQKAPKSIAEIAKMGEVLDINLIGAPYALQFGLNANRSMRLLSEGEDEDFIFFPTDFGIGKEDDEPAMSDAIAAGNAAGADSATADDSEEADETAHTRMDEIEEMVESLPDPEDVPTKLTYRYNPDMMIEQTAENIEVLERIVEAEATDQDVYGRMLVANVVINRVHSKYFKNTVKGVVFETIGGYEQFAPIRDGRYFTVPITEKTREAVRRVLAGEDYSDGALYFFQRDITTDKKAAWFDNNLKFLFKYGCHEFYTEFSEYNKKNK